MSPSTQYGSDPELIGALQAGRPDALALVYERYAPVLYGVIEKIVGDKDRAASALAETFDVIQATIADCPANRPLFLWLFSTARQTAATTLDRTKKGLNPLVQLTPAGQITIPTPLLPANAKITKYGQFLNAVLFDRCTPEEASQSAGLPVAEARQHLRQAFLQLRGA